MFCFQCEETVKRTGCSRGINFHYFRTTTMKQGMIAWQNST